MLEISWRKESRPRPPHVEGGSWAVRRKLPQVGYVSFLNHLGKMAVTDLASAFGDYHDASKDGNPGFPPGRGTCSLATLRVSHSEVYFDHRDKVRIRFRAVDSPELITGVPLNDLAFLQHLPGCSSCKRRARFGDCLLRIGLGRPFAPDAERGESCWLQVNAIFPIQDDWPHFYQEPTS
jgi:hypothetical protein